MGSELFGVAAQSVRRDAGSSRLYNKSVTVAVSISGKHILVYIISGCFVSVQLQSCPQDFQPQIGQPFPRRTYETASGR